MKKRLCLLLSILILIFLFAGCVRNENPVIESLDDLDGRKVGIVLGTIHDKVVSERLPGAEQVFFNNEIDGTAALESGRIDALVRTLGSGQFIIYANPNLTMLDDHLLDTEVGFALPKTDNGRLLDEQLSEFIQRLQESGGQKQRVAIARALAMDPEIILFDEPTSALDPSMVGEVESVIRSLSENGTTMMIVTHDMAFARSICNRVFYLDEGIIYEEGTPEEIFGSPKKEKTRRFIRQLKVLEFKIDPASFDVHHLYGQIDDFCIRNRIVEQTVKKIRLVIEEMCLQILMPGTEKTVIKGDIVFYSDTGSVSIELSYEGGKFDPFMSDNKLSVKIIEGISDIHESEYNEDSHMNTVKIRV